MHRSEAGSLGRCWGCGAEVSTGVDRAFAFGDAGLLCFACAAERGGVYDELHDRWTEPPRLAGIERPEA